MATLGLSIIALNESDNLPGLLTSVEGAFDQVALLDTGSTDGTQAIFSEWAETQNFALGYRLESFEWCDDFGLARNTADSLLETDWLAWADCDDSVGGARNLHAIAAAQPSDVAGLQFPYFYVPWAPRYRGGLARQGRSWWEGKVHECLKVEGRQVQSDEVVWYHRNYEEDRADKKLSYLEIARNWIEEEPSLQSTTVAAMLEAECGELTSAARHLRSYLDLFTVRMQLGEDGLDRAEAALGKIEAASDRQEAMHHLPAALGIDDTLVYLPEPTHA